jgi:hypothetical protein
VESIESDKRSHFNMFLKEANQNPKLFVNLAAERKAIREKVTTGTHAWKKKRWIREFLYGGSHEKADVVCKQLKDLDLSEVDKYFPKDEDETYYWVEVERKRDDITKAVESISGNLSMDVSHEEADDLFGKNGFLNQDMNPAVKGLSQKANENFLVALEKESGITLQTKTKKQKEQEAKEKADAERKAAIERGETPPEEEKPPAVDAATAAINAYMADLEVQMAKCLAQASKAREFATRLQAHDLGEKLVTQFETHANIMEQASKNKIPPPPNKKTKKTKQQKRRHSRCYRRRRLPKS